MRHHEFSSLFIEKGSCCFKCFDQKSMDLTFIIKTRFWDFANLIFRLRKFLKITTIAQEYFFLSLYINNTAQKTQNLS